MKHRKKQNTIQNKQEEQHQRNLFYKKMQNTIALLGDASAFGLLDKKMLEFLYYSRIRPYRIIAQSDRQLKNKSKLLNTLNTTLSEQLHKTFIDIGQQKTRVSLYDFGVYIETLYLFWRNADLHKPEFASRFRACFTVFNDDFQETRVQALTSVNQKLEIISWLYSDITTKIFRFIPERFDKTSSMYGNSAYYNNYLLEVKDAETETLEIDGHKRTIYRACATTNEAFIPMTITPEKLGMGGLMQKFPLKVFIQMHAFERIEIRLGKLFRMFHYPYIIAAILKSEPVPADNKNSFLIPVTNLTARLGYLKADVMGDKLVIRTFLFLTNNGTPEGKKLNQLAGLQKVDKSYLGIDKLSTFILSDIKKDEKLKALFCEAGCGELFKLDKTLINEPGDRELATAKFITHYLGI
jgi:hypothetical protein